MKHQRGDVNRRKLDASQEYIKYKTINHKEDGNRLKSFEELV